MDPSVDTMAKDHIAVTNHEYLPIAGLQEFRELAVRMVFEDQSALKEQRVPSTRNHKV